MGVYIKDIDKANSCMNCVLLHARDNLNCDYDNCPLFEVLPHGDLIDRNALIAQVNRKVMETYIDIACQGVHLSSKHEYLLRKIIYDAPVIIPAERGE